VLAVAVEQPTKAEQQELAVLVAEEMEELAAAQPLEQPTLVLAAVAELMEATEPLEVLEL